jgi:hypothetical protein
MDAVRNLGQKDQGEQIKPAWMADARIATKYQRAHHRRTALDAQKRSQSTTGSEGTKPS